jgi:hypothetical protein
LQGRLAFGRLAFGVRRSALRVEEHERIVRVAVLGAY